MRHCTRSARVRFRETLTRDAERLAFDEKKKARDLRHRLDLHDETKAKLESDLDDKVAAGARLDTYQPLIDDTPQCPRCRIWRARKEPMVDHGTQDQNLFKCHECGYLAFSCLEEPRHR
ncbi:hypothetical protein B5V02_22315 [Mesorhizobium kowhaii]|uniref:Uncharacterized protein n=1 Tax=Mesorhizobium kowhaii TaxID=1300272 RepID=A0A2W7BYU5_9HYPH|nr:hypothetical protein B5V02_22315 [Mesorhizobium kowhaii]